MTKSRKIHKESQWEKQNFSSDKDDWKKVEKNNLTIAFNALYAKNKKIYSAYVSKHNTDR